ncbi:hypothetical protein [Aggregatilinea lenta]|uniref:hypothetical protein n=1 Tax=Aggregatilinea lenta TaxID=913108 RepID=UPI0013C32D27|nr:hypothetical protein [Aggregatilinea lenta]
MKRYAIVCVLSVMLAAILVACGDADEAGDAAPSAVPADTIVVTVTPAPEHTLPPTWTPPPTLTPLPDQPTLEITLDRPTATSFTLPTLTPRPTDEPDAAVQPAAPDEADSGTIEVTLSQATINSAVASAVAPAVGIYFGQAPAVTLGGGWIRLELPLLTTPGNAATQRMIAVEMDLTVVDGRVQVNLWRIYAEDTGEAFETDLSDDLVAEVQNQIDAQLASSVGPDGRFAVVDAVVRAGEISFTLQPLDAAPEP